jgi:hypothetical protein
VARWKRGVGRPPVPATVRERMRALIAEDPEEAPLEVLRRLREEGHRLGESTFYRLHRAERERLSKELLMPFDTTQDATRRNSRQPSARKTAEISRFCNVRQHLEAGIGGLWLRRVRVRSPSVTPSSAGITQFSMLSALPVLH